MSRVIRVLVVDDSALVRESLAALLGAEVDLVVITASDPLIAMRKMAEAPPDVIILDLRLPRMDGITFLRKLMAEGPVPVVVCSAYADATGAEGIEALRAGAVAIIEKPTFGVREFLEEAARGLVETVRAAAQSRPRSARRIPIKPPAAPPRAPVPRAPVPRAWPPIVAIGASTGGTEALATVFEGLPADAPGMVVVQHIPARFSRALAQSLDRAGPVRVREAASGDEVRSGVALLAPGDRHVRVRRRGGGYFVELDDSAPVSRHRPSVDVLFLSVAAEAAANGVGVLLTGMGEDGADGLLAIKRAGGLTFAQDEESCVVFGMPRAAIERGAASRVLSVGAMATAIARTAWKESRS